MSWGPPVVGTGVALARAAGAGTTCAVAALLIFILTVLTPSPIHAGAGVWTPIGPYGGTVRALLFDPAHPGVVYAGTTENGVFKSRDGGSSWAPMNQGFWSYRPIAHLALSPADPSTLYAVNDGGWFFRSVEGGPWQVIAKPSSFYPLALTGDPALAGVLWAACAGFEIPRGICRSADGGTTWEQLLSLDSLPESFAFDPRDPSIVYAGLTGWSGETRGALRSTDGGGTWEPINQGLPLGSEHTLVRTWLAVAPDASVLYASVWTPEGSFTFRSTDHGETWLASGPGGYPIAAGPGGFVVTGSGSRSLDGGETWKPGPGIAGRLLSLAANPLVPRRALAGSEQRGVYKTTNGGATWAPASRGMAATQALALVADPDAPGTLYASVKGGGLFKTDRSGLSWEPVETGFRHSDGLVGLSRLALDPSGAPLLYAILEGSLLLRSKDGGTSWSRLDDFGDHLALEALAVPPRHPGMVYAGGRGYRCPTAKSTDAGDTWQCLGVGGAREIVIDPARPENVYAITRQVYRSSDAGRTWEPASRGLKPDEALTLAVAPSDSNVLYVGLSRRGIWKSTDRGQTWQPVNGNLPLPLSVTSIAVDPRRASTVYAGISGALYRSVDGGRQWKSLNAGLQGLFQGPLLIDPNDPRTLYAGTETRGFYAITLPK